MGHSGAASVWPDGKGPHKRETGATALRSVVVRRALFFERPSLVFAGSQQELTVLVLVLRVQGIEAEARGVGFTAHGAVSGKVMFSRVILPWPPELYFSRWRVSALCC